VILQVNKDASSRSICLNERKVPERGGGNSRITNFLKIRGKGRLVGGDENQCHDRRGSKVFFLTVERGRETGGEEIIDILR